MRKLVRRREKLALHAPAMFGGVAIAAALTADVTSFFGVFKDAAIMALLLLPSIGTPCRDINWHY